MAIRKGWRLLSLTMSACTPADIPAYAPKTRTVSEPCAEWRDATLGLIELIRPAVVLAAGTRGFATVDASGAVLTGADRTAAWEGGVERTIDRLKSSGARVIWIADTPIARVDPPACLARHMRSTLACATPVSYAVNAAWLSEEHLVTQVESVGFIDPSLWVCPSSPCPAVIGNLLVYRDAGHMTATFMASLSARLEKAVAADLAAHPCDGRVTFGPGRAALCGPAAWASAAGQLTCRASRPAAERAPARPRGCGRGPRDDPGRLCRGSRSG